MLRRVQGTMLALCLIALVACTSTPDEAREQPSPPVGCSTAEADLALLEAEQVWVAEQVAAGVRTVLPISVVAGTLQRDSRNRARMPIADYYRELDERMFQIRQQCGITDGHLTADGLLELEHARVGFAAIKPGVDLRRYDQLMILPVAFKFKEQSRRLSEGQLDHLRRYFREDFTEKLQEEGGYNLVSHPGPGVLLVRAALINIDVTAPVDGRDEVYIRDAGEVTLVAEFRDSETGELLARAADRRRIEMVGGTAYESNPVTNIANTRRLFRQWASLLRERLDQAHELKGTRQ